MEAPSWRKRGTNGGHHKSVEVVLVVAVAEAVVAGCVADVTAPEEVDNTE